MIQARVTIWCWSICPELWDVFCEHLWKNWPPYNGTALYIHVNIYMSLPVTYYCLFVINILLPLVQTLDSSVWAPGLMKTATFGLHWPTLDRRTWDSGSSVWYVWPFFFITLRPGQNGRNFADNICKWLDTLLVINWPLGDVAVIHNVWFSNLTLKPLI